MFYPLINQRTTECIAAEYVTLRYKQNSGVDLQEHEVWRKSKLWAALQCRPDYLIHVAQAQKTYDLLTPPDDGWVTVWSSPL